MSRRRLYLAYAATADASPRVPSNSGKMKSEARAIIKEAMDALATKDDKVISASIKRKCDEKFGPTWNVIVGEDFKAAVSHENKHYLFTVMGKTNLLLYKV